MNSYDELIRQEEAKLTLLRQKVAACEQRIAALRTLAQSDDIDEAVASAVVAAAARERDAQSIAQPPTVPQVGGASGAELPAERGDGRQVRKDSVVIDVLSYLQDGVKSLDEISGHLKHIGRERSRGYLRTALMTWRTKNAWVVNPQPGRYGLSTQGQAFLATNKGESPSTANAEAFSLQASPGTGTAAVGVRRRAVRRRSA